MEQLRRVNERLLGQMVVVVVVAPLVVGKDQKVLVDASLFHLTFLIIFERVVTNVALSPSLSPLCPQ